MPDANLAQLEAAFLEACDLGPGDRTAYIERFSPDPLARARLRTLLEHDARASRAFLAGLPTFPTDSQGLYRPGDVVARYRLERLIGSGGFGEVWLAEQQSPVKRAVALKIIKPGMDTRELIARFEAERQTLALLDHPAIAKVFDAGATDRARPFFVMEYVPGVAITRYCHDHALDIPARLGLFLDVCAGVQHAHQKGVIHRDLKPGNILVRDTGAAPPATPRPAPVIIDFGIAKTVQSALGAEGGGAGGPGVTATRGALLGTPEYMSPEQAALPGGVGVGGGGGAPAPDTRSDVYSLGVVLYELLVGAQPFRRSSALDPTELRRRILEDTPTRPSSRVMDAPNREPPRDPHRDPAPRAPSTTTPRQRRALRDHLRGDLDWIVLKALEKEPARRYSSVAELAADIRRHLAHEPVLAGPPSVRYRVRKFIRRHRAAAISLAAIAAMLLLATALSTRFALREAQQRRVAETNLALAQRRTAIASLAAAHAAIADENQPLALKNLGLVPPELRGWEWDHLRLAADSALYRLPHHDDVLGAVVPPDADRVYTLDAAGLLRAWNIADGAPLSSTHLEPPHGLLAAVSLDHNLAITAGDNAAAAFDLTSGLALWRAATGIPSLIPNSSRIVHVAADPPRVLITDVRSGESRTLPIAKSLHRPNVSVAPTGDMALLQSYADAVVISLDDARILARPVARSAAWSARANHDSAVPELWLQSGDSRAADRFDRFDLATQRPAPLDLPPFVPDSAAALAPDARAALVITAQRARLIHEALPGAVPLTRLNSPARGIAFSRDGAIAIVSGERDGVAAWDTTDVPLARPTSVIGLATAVAAIAPDAALVARAGWGDVQLWDAPTGMPLWRTYFSRQHISTIAWSTDGAVIAAASRHNELALFDAATGRIIDRTTLAFTPHWLAVGPGGAHVAFGGPPGQAALATRRHNTWTFTPIVTSHASATSAGALTRDASTLAILGVTTASTSAALDVYDIAALARPRYSRPSTSARATALAFSADARTLWAASEHDSVLIACDAATGDESARYAGGFAPLTAITQHPAGNRLATLVADGTLTLWSVRTHDPVCVWPSTNPVALAFTPDGDDLVVSAIDFPVHRFETRRRAHPGRLTALRGAALAERFATNPLSAAAQDSVAASGAPADIIAPALDYLRRLGDSANHCNSEAWRHGLVPDADPADYEMALRQVDASLRTFPDNGGILNTRALVLLRLHRWDDALADARRSDALLASTNPDGLDINVAIAAMALHGAGAAADARAELARLATIIKHHPVDDAQAAALLDEARKLIDPAEPPRTR